MSAPTSQTEGGIVLALAGGSADDGLAGLLRERGYALRELPPGQARTGLDCDDPTDLLVLDSARADAAAVGAAWKQACPRRLRGLVVLGIPDDDERWRLLGDEHLPGDWTGEQALELIEAELTRLNEERKYIRHAFTLEAKSDPESILEVGDYLEAAVAASGIGQETAVLFVNAVREALDNAATHGNRDAPGARVRLEYLLAANRITATVTDEGEGFDTRGYLGEGLEGDAVAVAHKWRKDKTSGGLGVILMLRCLDSVEYNGKGNSVKLTRRLEPETSGTSAPETPTAAC